jgi:hypothetical protein
MMRNLSLHGPGGSTPLDRASAAYRAAATGQLPTLAFGRRLVVPTFRLMQMLGIPEEASR